MGTCLCQKKIAYIARLLLDITYSAFFIIIAFTGQLKIEKGIIKNEIA